MKFKVIENEMPAFEKDINVFVSNEKIQVIDIQYSTAGVSGDEGAGWLPMCMHSALIHYIEFE